MAPDTRSFTLEKRHAGERLDKSLADVLRGVPRARVQALIRAGRVQVDGAVVTRPATSVGAGQSVAVDLAPEPEPAPDATPESRTLPELSVLFEDRHIAVIAKPAGMLAHKSHRPRGDSVSELALARWGELPHLQGADRPGVVHRLDAGTSGVMVLALERGAMKHLIGQFRARTVKKTYIALVHGEARFDTGWIETPIQRSAARPERMESAPAGSGRPATTYYEVQERLRGFSVLACQPKTGRTHQIRVHLASIDLPIVCDPLYRRGGPHPVPVPAGAPLLARQALHAARLELTHPASGERLAFEAPLAQDMQELLDWLRRRA
jgi:23S rRNA pseudouridine1911/1915/1917 synthase